MRTHLNEPLQTITQQIVLPPSARRKLIIELTETMYILYLMPRTFGARDIDKNDLENDG